MRLYIFLYIYINWHLLGSEVYHLKLGTAILCFSLFSDRYIKIYVVKFIKSDMQGLKNRANSILALTTHQGAMLSNAWGKLQK